MRVIDRVSPPLRGVVVASLLLGAAGAVAIAIDVLDAPEPPRGQVIDRCRRVEPAPATHVAPGPVAVHAKHVRFGADLVSLHGTAVHAHALFSHLLTTRDQRARWIRIEVASEQEASELVAKLVADPAVEQAFVAPAVSLARNVEHGDAAAYHHLPGYSSIDPFPAEVIHDDDSCPITTPSFESYQGYLGPAPHGIDAPAAWRRGHRGA